MNKFKKLLNIKWVAGILFLLLIFALPGLKGRAESLYYLDFSNEVVYIQAGDHNTMYFAFVDKGKTPSDKNFVPVMAGFKVRNENFLDGTADCFCIDLSAQTFKKETTLYFRFDDEKSAEKIEFEARKTLKASYYGKELLEGDIESLYPSSKFDYFNKETGYFLFYLDEEFVTYLPGNIEWRAGSSMNYRPITELNINLYLERGATLYFRYNSGGTHISKEAKVKLKAMTNAPTAKLDGNKMSISLKDTMEYRIITDSETGMWCSVCEGAKYLLLKDMGLLGGDGNYKQYSACTIEYRVKGTEKAHASRSRKLELVPVEKPVEGPDGITVTQVSCSDIKKGLLVKNNSDEAYQIAIVAHPQGNSLSQILFSLDPGVKKGEYGYISWKNVSAGGKATISYSSFKDLGEYWILYRKASVKDNTKTPENEFRTASVIKAYGGSTPTCDTKGGAVILESGSITKTIHFTYDDGNELYVSTDGGSSFNKNTSGTVSFSASAGDTVSIKAYALNTELEEQSSVVSLTFKFVQSGELADYRNKWGYEYYKKEDAKKGTNSRQLLYQRIYLSYLTYQSDVDYSDLTDITTYDLLHVLYSVRADNPQLIQAQPHCSYTSTTLRLKFYDADTTERLLSQCDNSVAEIENNIKTKYGSVAAASKVQIVKEIHDYIVLKKEYKDSAFAQTMAGALSDEYTPVCMSYALAMKYCCEHFGIQCEMIFGNAKNGNKEGEAHGWNIINYGETVNYASANTLADFHTDTWYEMDVTWDDPIGPGVDYIGYDYFNLTTDQINNSRVRKDSYYPAYPFDKCTGTDLSYNNCYEQNLFK